VGSADDATCSPPRLTRRSWLAAAAGSAVVLAACGTSNQNSSLGSAGRPATTTTPRPATPSTSAAGTVARFVAVGPATRRQVALTFHTNGDLTLAGELLNAVEQHRTPITAFVVGDWLAANPTWASRLLDAGAELANHTYRHLEFASLPSEEQLSEIVQCRDVLVRLTGSPGRYFRPSGTAEGKVSPPDSVLAITAEAGYRTLLGFDVDPLDYQSPGAAAITDRTLAAAHPGAIISLHFGYPETITALPGILAGLDARSLTPVTASTLLGDR